MQKTLQDSPFRLFPGLVAALFAFSAVSVSLAAPPTEVQRLDLVIAASDAAEHTVEALAPGEVKLRALGASRVTLSYRNDQFRGSHILVLQLMKLHSDGETRSLQLDPAMPGRHWLDNGWRIDAWPRAWLARYCSAFDAIEEPVERPASAHLTADGHQFLSPPDWDGQAEVALQAVAMPDSPSGWTVAASKDGQSLRFVHKASQTLLGLPADRDDMPVLRHQTTEAGLIQYGFTPAAYSFRLCQDSLPEAAAEADRLEHQLTAYFLGEEWPARPE
ncbi:MAG: hypothetical protein ACXIUB_09060 [Wenzhouxiangella sp.]